MFFFSTLFVGIKEWLASVAVIIIVGNTRQGCLQVRQKRVVGNLGDGIIVDLLAFFQWNLLDALFYNQCGASCTFLSVLVPLRDEVREIYS